MIVELYIGDVVLLSETKATGSLAVIIQEHLVGRVFERR